MEATDILLIRDSDESQQLLAADLRNWGYNVRCMAPSVVPQQEQLAPPCRLIILDTSSENDGYSLAETIHQKAAAPVLLLVDGERRAEPEHRGHSITVLRRPYRQHHLLRLVERLITAETVGKSYDALLDRLQDFTLTGHWVMEHGRVTPCFSTSLRNLLGLDGQRSMRATEELLALVHPEDEQLVRRRYDDLRKGEPHHLEYRILRPGGGVRVIRDSSFLVPAGPGSAPRMIGLLQDVTCERKNLEALHKCRQEMDEFAHIASHDLQEPLRAMTSFMQLLKSRYGDRLDDKGMDFINRSCKAGNRMELLIKELLKLARISTRGASFEPTDLNELFDRVKEKLEAAQKGKSVSISSCRLPQLSCDGRQIQTLFHTILENGLKFNTSNTPTLTIDCRQDGDSHHFTVTDNGIGIAEEFHQRIFTVFQRLHTEKEYPGLGSGLALAKRIVERHGGAVWLDSAPGDGTTIHFTLPADEVQDNCRLTC